MLLKIIHSLKSACEPLKGIGRYMISSVIFSHASTYQSQYKVDLPVFDAEYAD